MHVATSIRHGLNDLITNDKQLLARAGVLAAWRHSPGHPGQRSDQETGRHSRQPT